MIDMRVTAMPRRGPLPVVIYAAIAVTMLASFVLTAGLWSIDARTLDGPSVWAKPLKFELALALHAGTLAVIMSRHSKRFIDSALMRAVALAFLAACIIEMGWIIGQAAQGQPSHFNDSTAFHRAMFSVMAFCAVIITGAAGAVAVAVWCDRDFAAPLPVRAGIVIGLLGGTVLTLVTAFAIGARGSPYVGPVPDIAARMVFTGWSLSGGDLRVAHFLATHMMQAVPLAALAIVALLPRVRLALVLVALFALGWSVWVLAAFQQALAGIAFLPLALQP